MKTFFLSLWTVTILILGLIIGFYIHKYQPPFYTKTKNFLIYGKFLLPLEDKEKRIYPEYYTLDIIKKKSQRKFLNEKEFKNFFHLVAYTSFENFKKKKFLKINFLENNILDKNQISFPKPKEEDFKDLKDFWFDDNYSRDSYEIYKVKYYDYYNIGILHKSKKNKKNKLIIYHQGHSGNSYNKDYFLELKSKYVNEGYDILNLNMPLIGINMMANKYFEFPINPYKNILPNEHIKYPFSGITDRQIFRYIYDKNYPNKKPLSFFLSGNYYLIEKILSLKNYNEIKIIGHSGGGVLAAYYMFLIPEISKGYISSSFFTRTHYIDQTDREWFKFYSDFVMKNNYFDLIYGSLIDENNQFSRELIFQFNNLDPNCCAEPYSNNFTNLINEIGRKFNFKLKGISLNNNAHEINLETLYQVF